MNIPKALKKNLKISAVIWAACLVLFVLIYILVLGPQSRTRERLESEYNESKQTYEFAQNAAREETKNRLLEQIESLRNDLGVFTTDIEDSAGLIFDISRIAREKNVSSLNVEKAKEGRASDEDLAKNISESNINISFVAGFSEFAAFLNALERHKPVLFVNEFELVQSNQNNSVYQVDIDVAALIKKQQGDKATAKSAQAVSEEKI
jgi:Tfp pilus assembly protein PilO